MIENALAIIRIAFAGDMGDIADKPAWNRHLVPIHNCNCSSTMLCPTFCQLIRITDVPTVFSPGALICLFPDLYGFDIPRRTTYFTGTATIAFQRIYNGVGFICFFIPGNFNCIEETGVHTSIAVRNAKYT